MVESIDFPPNCHGSTAGSLVKTSAFEMTLNRNSVSYGVKHLGTIAVNLNTFYYEEE